MFDLTYLKHAVDFMFAGRGQQSLVITLTPDFRKVRHILFGSEYGAKVNIFKWINYPLLWVESVVIIGQTCIGKRCQDDIFPRIELIPLSSCQVTILITRMLFNSFSSCLMSKVSIEITINTYRRYEHAKQWNDNSQFSSHK